MVLLRKRYLSGFHLGEANLTWGGQKKKLDKMITRRHFLAYTAGALASASFGGLFPKYVACKTSTNVCIIKSPRIWQNGSIDQGEVGLMLEAGIRMLSGTEDLAKGWKTYFAVNDTIALKVNPITRQTGSTKPEIRNERKL